MAFASDNCNVMLGARNSVLSRVREKQPDIFTIGCICHLASLCAGAGISALSTPVDDLLVDIYYHFEHRLKTNKKCITFFQAMNVIKSVVKS